MMQEWRETEEINLIRRRCTILTIPTIATNPWISPWSDSPCCCDDVERNVVSAQKLEEGEQKEGWTADRMSSLQTTWQSSTRDPVYILLVISITSWLSTPSQNHTTRFFLQIYTYDSWKLHLPNQWHFAGDIKFSRIKNNSREKG